MQNQKMGIQLFDASYWTNRYHDDQTGWDLGETSPPLKHYFDQLTHKSMRILIPGAGNAYEAEYLHEQGFTNVFVADISQQPLENLQKRCPSFPKEHLLHHDFFELEPAFDLIVEQTFFCALHPSLRENYIVKMHELLADGGKLMGVLFNIPLFDEHPPFGGNKEVYYPLFNKSFEIIYFDVCYNSIKPRANSELFILVKKHK